MSSSKRGNSNSSYNKSYSAKKNNVSQKKSLTRTQHGTNLIKPYNNSLISQNQTVQNQNTKSQSSNYQNIQYLLNNQTFSQNIDGNNEQEESGQFQEIKNKLDFSNVVQTSNNDQDNNSYSNNLDTSNNYVDLDHSQQSGQALTSTFLNQSPAPYIGSSYTQPQTNNVHPHYQTSQSIMQQHPIINLQTQNQINMQANAQQVTKLDQYLKDLKFLASQKKNLTNSSQQMQNQPSNSLYNNKKQNKNTKLTSQISRKQVQNMKQAYKQSLNYTSNSKNNQKKLSNQLEQSQKIGKRQNSQILKNGNLIQDQRQSKNDRPRSSSQPKPLKNKSVSNFYSTGSKQQKPNNLMFLQNETNSEVALKMLMNGIRSSEEKQKQSSRRLSSQESQNRIKSNQNLQYNKSVLQSNELDKFKCYIDSVLSQSQVSPSNSTNLQKKLTQKQRAYSENKIQNYSTSHKRKNSQALSSFQVKDKTFSIKSPQNQINRNTTGSQENMINLFKQNIKSIRKQKAHKQNNNLTTSYKQKQQSMLSDYSSPQNPKQISLQNQAKYNTDQYNHLNYSLQTPATQPFNLSALQQIQKFNSNQSQKIKKNFDNNNSHGSANIRKANQETKMNQIQTNAEPDIEELHNVIVKQIQTQKRVAFNKDAQQVDYDEDMITLIQEQDYIEGNGNEDNDYEYTASGKLRPKSKSRCERRKSSMTVIYHSGNQVIGPDNVYQY